MSSSLTELTTRVAHLAESVSGSERDDIAAALFEVERSLRAAERRLQKLVSGLR